MPKKLTPVMLDQEDIDRVEAVAQARAKENEEKPGGKGDRGPTIRFLLRRALTAWEREHAPAPIAPPVEPAKVEPAAPPVRSKARKVEPATPAAKTSKAPAKSVAKVEPPAKSKAKKKPTLAPRKAPDPAAVDAFVKGTTPPNAPPVESAVDAPTPEGAS